MEGVSAATSQDPDAVDDLLRRKPGGPGGDLRDLVACGCRPPEDFVEVDLRASRLRVARIAPVEHEQLHSGFLANTPITEPREVPTGVCSILVLTARRRFETGGTSTGYIGRRSPTPRNTSRAIL